MDWGKAKNILIAIFIILNMFLGVNMAQAGFSQGPSKELTENAVTILKTRGIELECEIPNSSGIMKRIALSKTPAADLAKAKYEKPGPDLTRQKSVEKHIREFLKKSGIREGEFKTDIYQTQPDGGVKIGFIQEYKGFPIFDNRIRISLDSQGIKELEIGIREPEETKLAPENIMPAYKVLLINFGPQDKGTIITGIDIGYASGSFDEQRTHLLGNPVWRVKKADGSIGYFNAYTGTPYDVK